jgi:hypothetical protein
LQPGARALVNQRGPSFHSRQTCSHNSGIGNVRRVLNSNRENVMTCVSLTTSQGGSSGRWREQNLSRASFSDNAAPGGFAQGDDDNNGNENDENSSSSLVELRVQKVVQSQRANASSVLYLFVKDGSRRVLPVYVGDAECAALEMELSNNNEHRQTDLVRLV